MLFNAEKWENLFNNENTVKAEQIEMEQTERNNRNGYVENTNYKPNPPTEKQLETVYNTCKWKHIPVDESRLTSSKDCGQYIAWLFEQPVHPTEAQLNKARELCKEIGYPIPEDLDGYDGSRDGKMSQFIQFLINKKAEMQDQLPPTDNQVELIVKYQMCPDICAGNGKAEDGRIICLTKSDVKKMSRQMAKDYIAKNRDTWAVWTKSRASATQIATYNAIQKSMGNAELTFEEAILYSSKDMTKLIEQSQKEQKMKPWIASSLEAPDNKLNEKRIHDEDSCRNSWRTMAARLAYLVDKMVEEGYDLSSEYSGDWFENANLDDYKELCYQIKDALMDEVKGFDEFEKMAKINKRLRSIFDENVYMDEEQKKYILDEAKFDGDYNISISFDTGHTQFCPKDEKKIYAEMPAVDQEPPYIVEGIEYYVFNNQWYNKNDETKVNYLTKVGLDTLYPNARAKV